MNFYNKFRRELRNKATDLGEGGGGSGAGAPPAPIRDAGTSGPSVIDDKVLRERIYGAVDERIQQTYGMTREDFAQQRLEIQWMAGEMRRQEREGIAVRTEEDTVLMPLSYRKQAHRVLAADSRRFVGKQGLLTERAPAYDVPMRGAGLIACRIFRALACEALGKTDDARKLAHTDWGDPGTAELIDAWKEEHKEYRSGDIVSKRALGSEILSDGGVLIPEKFLAEIIPLLRAQSVMLSLGIRTLPLENGMSIRIPRHISSVTAQWAQENVEMNASQGSLGFMSLNLRKLSIITVTANELLMMASPLADAWIREDILDTGGLALDYALLYGTGAGSEPRGARYAALPANVSARSQAGASSTLNEINRDLHDVVEDVEGNNKALSATAWLMTSREKNVGLMSLLDGNGNPIFRGEMSRGTLLGHPYKVTNQIPKNLGGGDESELFFGAWDGYWFAEGRVGSIKSWDGGTYRDSAGSLVSGISADQTVMRMNWFADGDAKHPEALAVRTAMDWGALV